MITVTLGTISYPFDRAIAWVAQLLESQVIDEPIFIQHGASSVAAISGHPLVTTMPTVARTTLEQWVAQSRLVIAHAGQGTTRMLIERQANFILLPRLSEHDEHVDDHQLIFAQSTQALGVLHSLSLEGLASAIIQPPQAVQTDFFDGPKLSAHLLSKYPASTIQPQPSLQSVR